MSEIPKIIHYCWFGGNPLPEMAVKCIESWKKYLPDYKIKEWNEHNFDIAICDYVQEAYEAKKWAFVSDYARFWILYNYGGLYFDTDVELIKKIDDIVEKGPFMGCEPLEEGVGNMVEKTMNCAPGLGLGVTPGLSLYAEVLNYYDSLHYKTKEGAYTNTTVVTHVTGILRKHDWHPDGTVQYIDGVYIYPPDYFCPMNYYTGEMTITENTRTIHHYLASWQSDYEKKIHVYIQKISKRFGKKKGTNIEKIITAPIRLKNKVCQIGIVNTLKYIFSRV